MPSSKHARDHAFHPVRNYLDRLAWDGKDRLRTWLTNCFGAEDNDYTDEIGKMFLISMVARIYRPGCKVDYMMILEGEQGLLKSSACRILAGGLFQRPAARHHRQGSIPASAREMADRGRRAARLLARGDRSLQGIPGARHRTLSPAVGTQGGARAAAVRVHRHHQQGALSARRDRQSPVLADEDRRDRSRLAARQSRSIVRRGRRALSRWRCRGGRIAEFELETIRDEQEARYEPDVWEEPIRLYLDGLPTKRTTILEVAIGALKYEKEPPIVTPYQPYPTRGTPINRLTPNDQHRIAAVLTYLKWAPKRHNRPLVGTY